MSSPNPRASLLAGLRTGGVRSASQPSIVPHTAAPGGSFNVPRFASYSNQGIIDEDDDQLADLMAHNMHLNGSARRPPATASAADASTNMFQQQQHAALFRTMAAQRAAAKASASQLPYDQSALAQVMQMEMLKLQALQQAQQVQQYQAELIAQAQYQQQQQQQQQRAARRSSTYGEPVTAGPGMAFDLRGSAHNGSADAYDDIQVPMTAALGGKFGSRSVSSGLNPNANVFTLRGDGMDEPPKTAGLGRTTVISGGTALGSATSSSSASNNNGPLKSDSAVSWRRAGSNPASTLAPSPLVKITPPSADQTHFPSVPPGLKGRPVPLRFNGTVTAPDNAHVTIELDDGTDSSDDSLLSDSAQVITTAWNGDGDENDSPSTPPSAGSSGSLSAREEASKRLYEGLGIGRPTQAAPAPVPVVSAPIPRVFSQPIRQPKGPPASVDELGPRNFANRMPMKILVAQY